MTLETVLRQESSCNTGRECIATQDIGKIIEAVEISPSEALELQQAEALTRAFIRWDLSDDGDDSGRTMETLREMIEAADQIRGDSVE